MRFISRVLILFSIGWLSYAHAQDQQKIKKLIEQLGDEGFQIREKAHEELIKIGKPALGLLKKALKSKDPEVIWRARNIISRIEIKLLDELPTQVKKEGWQLSAEFRSCVWYRGSEPGGYFRAIITLRFKNNTHRRINYEITEFSIFNVIEEELIYKSRPCKGISVSPGELSYSLDGKLAFGGVVTDKLLAVIRIKPEGTDEIKIRTEKAEFITHLRP
jgi:hypothetical protein